MSHRTCGECTLCCKALAVTELQKPQAVWCIHCRIGSGCSIYSERPESCRSFSCLYLQSPDIPEEMRPDRLRAVVSFTGDGETPLIHIDPKTPDVYRRGALHTFVEGCRARGLDVILVAGERRKLLANYKAPSKLLGKVL